MIFSIIKFVLGTAGSKGAQMYVQAPDANQAAAKVADKNTPNVEVRAAKNQDSSTYKRLLK